MNKISNLLVGKSVSDARAVLYYLSRYLKQAAHYEQYRKDIFEDDSRNYPSQDLIESTWKIIAAIESEQGIKIVNFDHFMYVESSKNIALIENSLDPAPSIADIAAASVFSNSMIIPKKL